MSATMKHSNTMTRTKTRSGIATSHLLHIGLSIAGLVLAIALVELFSSQLPGRTPGTERLVSGLIGMTSSGESISELATGLPTEETESESPGETLTPRMRAALDSVTRRYRVSAAALEPIFLTAQTSGHERQLDPLLIVAIIGIESGFNPFAESSMGALGLMQVIPRFHLDKVPQGAGRQAFLDPVINVRIGTRALHESIRRQGGLIAGLQQFGGAIDDDERGYSSKVLAEKLRLENAVRRNGISS